MGRKLTDANRLSLNSPELAKQWHPTKNGDLTPADVSKGSGKKVWWRCEKCHEWEANICDRTRGSGCPFCGGKRPTDETRLSVCYPEIAKQWHPTKNGGLTSHAVRSGSNKKVWWICDVGHEWDAVIVSRTKGGHGCRYCAIEINAELRQRPTDENRLSLKSPEIAKEWHPTKNGDLTPHNRRNGSGEKVWWLCDNGHEWEAVISSRTLAGNGCPYCGGKLPTDETRLSVRYPEIAKQWHPDKNGDLTAADVQYASNKKVWWICDVGHEWEAVIGSRTTNGRGCQVCAIQINAELSRRPTDENRLSLKSPEIAKEWHPTKNGDLTPHNRRNGSNEKVWWLCDNGHEWEAVISSRTLAGNGCPYCGGKLPTDENRLSIRYPEIAAQWHPDKNGDLTAADVQYASNKKAWWLCERGHAWDAVIASRTLAGNGCRFCNMPHRSKVEIYLACELSAFFPDIAPAQTHKIETTEGKVLDVDILIPSISMAIEYDGTHWHKDKFEQDTNKTTALKAVGWNVLRIREEPLPLIQPTDLQREVTFSNDATQLKRLTNDVLAHLDETFGVYIPGLGEYLASDSLLNEAAANDIIDDEYAKWQDAQENPELPQAAAQQLTLFAIDA